MNNLAMLMCLALMPIRHNGKNYPKGAVIEMPSADSFFLKKVGYVRQATPDEITAYQQTKQAQPLNSHLPPTHQANDDGFDDKNDKKSPVADKGLDSEPDDKNDKKSPVADKGLDSEPDDKSELNSPLVETTPDKTAEVTVVDYGKSTKAELIAELSKRQIEHNPKAKNDELEALLVSDDRSKTDDKTGAN